jgi:hypothetical protein
MIPHSPLFRSRALIGVVLLAVLPGVASAAISLVAWNAGGESTEATVDFQGAWTSESGVDLDGDAATDDSRFGMALGERTPLNPEYTDGRIFGGVSINTINNIVPDTLSSGNYSVHNASTDHLVVHSQHSGNHHHTFDALFYWDKAGFLNGGEVMGVVLDGTSIMSVETLPASLVKGDEHLHFVIRDGSQFYISEKYYGSAAGPNQLGLFPDGATASLAPNDSHWSLYDPSGLSLHFEGTTFNPHVFADITAFGFLVDSKTFDANSSRIEISGFSASAIPEPSVALLGGMMCLASVAWGRRRGGCLC